MWLVSIQGVRFGDEPDGTPSKVGVVTGPKDFINWFQSVLQPPERGKGSPA